MANITASTERVKVTLINGEETEVVIKKYLNIIDKYALLELVADDKGDDFIKVVPELAKKVWADKNVSIEEVEGSSLNDVILERLESFLGSFGIKGKNGSDARSSNKKDVEPTYKKNGGDTQPTPNRGDN
jgi:hypothetical protein